MEKPENLFQSSQVQVFVSIENITDPISLRKSRPVQIKYMKFPFTRN